MVCITIFWFLFFFHRKLFEDLIVFGDFSLCELWRLDLQFFFLYKQSLETAMLDLLRLFYWIKLKTN